MSPDLKAAYVEALAVAPVAEVILDTLAIRHSTLPQPIYLVVDNDDWTAALVAGGPMVTFQACAARLTLPTQDDGSMLPELTLEVDNVAALLTPYLDTANKSPDPFYVDFRAYLASDNTGPQTVPPLTLQLAGIEATSLQVTAKAQTSDVTGRRFPSTIITASRFPALQA